MFVDLTETRLVYISQGVRPSFIRNLQEAMNLCTNTPDLMTCDIRWHHMTSLPEHSWCSRASQPSRLEPCPRYVQVLGPAYHLLNVEVLPFDRQDIESDICIYLPSDVHWQGRQLFGQDQPKTFRILSVALPTPLPMLLFELPAGSGFQKPGCFWKMDLRLAPD